MTDYGDAAGMVILTAEEQDVSVGREWVAKAGLMKTTVHCKFVHIRFLLSITLPVSDLFAELVRDTYFHLFWVG